MRVLVTGSRAWSHPPFLWGELHALAIQAYMDYDGGHRLTVVHGDCPQGADRMARTWVRAQAPDLWLPVIITEEAHPAQWDVYGKAAGHIRNQEMVDRGADLVLAFIHEGSRGATDCVTRAQAAGIETRIFRTGEGTNEQTVKGP